MRYSLVRALAGVCLLIRVGASSPHSDSGGRYQRIVCVVPMVGAGTVRDPKRPMFTVPGDLGADDQAAGNPGDKRPPRAGIVAFQSVPTDDGQAAIVMFVAHRYSAFKPILSSPSVIRKFEQKDVSERELINQLRKYKHDFSIEMLRVGAL
jgi:hypothetical protein